MQAGRRAVITQSNYIPWKGYFDLIAAADEFVIYDDMQFTRRDWRNRNQIKSSHGMQWLTVPVIVKGKFDQRIRDTVVSTQSWAKEHCKTIAQEYAKAPYFAELSAFIFDLYDRAGRLKYLSEINFLFLQQIANFLGLAPNFHWSKDFTLAEERSERLTAICQQLGADEYITGPAARAYMNEDTFTTAGIKITYFDYSGYPEYPQLHGEFKHQVSIIDLLLNTGADASKYLKYTNKDLNKKILA